ncbi:ABC transporter ATP-binding protein, partial [Oharaeibacter diazotrophicus]
AAQARATAGVRAWQRLATACAVAGGAGYGLAVMEIDGASMIALAVAALRLASGGMQTVETWRQLSRLLPIYEQVRRREADCLAVGEPAAAPTPPRLRRSLSFAAVAYVHPGAPAPTLSGIDLELPARGVTALVGPSGAGKSTLVDLAMGLIAPTAGTVAVDGAVLGAADRVAWRGRVAYVPQDGFLFHDSIRANLAVAAPAADDAAIEAALRRAAADFVFALPDGLDTRVGDRGSRLSGGERQRIMIARALLQDADLVVFDESTSALDADTEAKVLAAVAELASRACVILVAHRPAAIALADRVVQLEAGRIVAVRERRGAAAG